MWEETNHREFKSGKQDGEICVGAIRHDECWRKRERDQIFVVSLTLVKN